MTTITRPKPSCPACGSSQIYVRVKGGSIVCRTCGTITPGDAR